MQPADAGALLRAPPRDHGRAHRAAGGHRRPAAHRHDDAASPAGPGRALSHDGVVGSPLPLAAVGRRSVAALAPRRDGEGRGGGDDPRRAGGAGHPPLGRRTAGRGDPAARARVHERVRRLRRRPQLHGLAVAARPDAGLRLPEATAAVPAVAETPARPHRRALAAQSATPLACAAHAVQGVPRRQADPDAPRPAADHSIDGQLRVDAVAAVQRRGQPGACGSPMVRQVRARPAPRDGVSRYLEWRALHGRLVPRRGGPRDGRRGAGLPLPRHGPGRGHARTHEAMASRQRARQAPRARVFDGKCSG